MPTYPAINELRQHCLDAIQANKTILDRLAGDPNIDEQAKLDMFGRVLDTSGDLGELLAMIDRMISPVGG